MFYKVEKITNRDSPEVVKLILGIQQKEFNLPITAEDQPDLLNIEECYIRPGGGFWGVFQNQDLIGTIGLLNAANEYGVIRKMFVHPQFRGKDLGIAQMLLTNLITYSRAIGKRYIFLGTIDILKAAIKFYERNGFVMIQKHELPDSFPQMNVDNVFYKLPLTPEIPG